LFDLGSDGRDNRQHRDDDLFDKRAMEQQQTGPNVTRAQNIRPTKPRPNPIRFPSRLLSNNTPTLWITK